MKQISCYEDSNKCILVDKDLVGKTTKIELRSGWSNTLKKETTCKTLA